MKFKKIGKQFLAEIDNYKTQNNLSYSKIADIVGVDRFYFANVRNKIKNHNIVPTDKLLEKFKKIGID